MEHEIISRAEAKAKGLKFYFTGKPCKHGNVAPRTSSKCICTCMECRKAERKRVSIHYDSNREDRLEYARRYRVENSDVVRERQRRWHEENRESVAESKRLYREENRDTIAESKRRYRKENSEAEAARSRRYRDENRKSEAERGRRWREDNRESELERGRRRYQENPEKALASCAKRRAAKRQAIPVWFSELDRLLVEEAYDLAAQRLTETGIEWHVDHMIPLRARKASGLHCAANIQVIPAAMNLSKNNKMMLTEPLAWLW